MRVLPREHGATVIWLCSFILALATLTETPDLPELTLFIVAAILALVALARLTGSSAKLMRLERHTVLLPVMSGLLTLFVPVGHLIMLRQLPAETVAVWVVFLTYTVAGVVYTRITVRAFLKMQAPAITAIMASAAIAILIETAVLSWLGWMHYSTALVLSPMVFFWMYVRSPPRSNLSSRIGIIRKIGFLQSANMIVALAVLAAAVRL